jgi:FkbM family methyltransferase
MPYYGVTLHFPKGSSAFRRVCEEGVYEHDNVRVLQELCAQDTFMFDVGANLGLMAVPILASVRKSHVISFEPSPNSLPWLRRTIAGSQFGSRWKLIEKAVAASPGTADFSVSAPAEGLYDSLLHTRRSPELRKVTVEVTSLDSSWKDLGRPSVSVIKIDVEGGELAVLTGANDCLASTRAFVLLEWCRTNLTAHGVRCDALFEFAHENEYQLYALPNVTPVRSALDLELYARWTESFLMAPLKMPLA